MRKKLTALTAIALILLVDGSGSVAQTTQAKTWFVVLQLEAANHKAPAATEQVSAAIRKRLDLLGISGDVSQGEVSSGLIRVNLPSLAERERVKRLLTTVSGFEVMAVVSPPLPAPVKTYPTAQEARAAASVNNEVITYEARPGGLVAPAVSFIITEKTPIMEGRDVDNAKARPQTVGSGYSIGITANRDQRLWNWTGSHLNSYVAVVINGRARSIAFVKSQFSAFEVLGDFSKAEAEDLALLMNAGDLPATVKIVKEGVITKQ